ncbi:hypothetical protein [Candidatus Nitrosocosmicus sp. R]
MKCYGTTLNPRDLRHSTISIAFAELTPIPFKVDMTLLSSTVALGPQ